MHIQMTNKYPVLNKALSRLTKLVGPHKGLVRWKQDNNESSIIIILWVLLEWTAPRLTTTRHRLSSASSSALLDLVSNRLRTPSSSRLSNYYKPTKLPIKSKGLKAFKEKDRRLERFLFQMEKYFLPYKYTTNNKKLATFFLCLEDPVLDCWRKWQSQV